MEIKSSAAVSKKVFRLVYDRSGTKHCPEALPLMIQSIYKATYSGGKSKKAETLFDNVKANEIFNSSDCANQGLNDSTECEAYVIYASLRRFRIGELNVNL